jgi:hypothetical protein
MKTRRFRVLVAVAALAVVASGCGDSGAPAADSSPTPAPSPSFDPSTVRACGYARKSVEGEGEVSFRATEDALSAAELSDVPALQQIAAKYASDGTPLGNIKADTGALRIKTWCLDHGMG